MLNLKESKVMDYIYSVCKDKQSCLISPFEIANHLMPRYEINDFEIDQIIEALVLDNYIDVVHSDNKGKLVYVISLKPKGEAYDRDKKSSRKRLYLIIVRTVLLAVLSFVIGVALKLIFL